MKMKAIAIIVGVCLASGVVIVSAQNATTNYVAQGDIVTVRTKVFECQQCGWMMRTATPVSFQFEGVNGTRYVIPMPCPRCLDKALRSIGVSPMVEVK